MVKKMDWREVASVELPSGATAADLLTLAEQLEAQAKAVTSKKKHEGVPSRSSLAPVVEEALDDLVNAHRALRTVEAKKSTEHSVVSEHAVDANDNADRSWRGLERCIDAARWLTDGTEPGREAAVALYERLFAVDGLRFINMRPRRQWDAACKLVAILDEPDVKKTLDALALTRHAQCVRAAHRAFGEAYGFLAAKAPSDSVTDTRAEQLALQHALRDYVLKVSAQVSKRDPSSGELANFLLAPFANLVTELSRDARAHRPKPSPAPANG
jgi:hypothetical protein